MTFNQNPGSREALEMGCECPVLDNEYGRGDPAGTFVIALGCPLHGDSRNAKAIASLYDFCIQHPELRFWQAVYAWTQAKSIIIDGEDVFYKE